MGNWPRTWRGRLGLFRLFLCRTHPRRKEANKSKPLCAMAPVVLCANMANPAMIANTGCRKGKGLPRKLGSGKPVAFLLHILTGRGIFIIIRNVFLLTLTWHFRCLTLCEIIETQKHIYLYQTTSRFVANRKMWPATAVVMLAMSMKVPARQQTFSVLRSAGAREYRVDQGRGSANRFPSGTT